MLSLKEYLTHLVPTTFQPASDLTMAGQTENGEDPRKTAALFKWKAAGALKELTNAPISSWTLRNTGQANNFSHSKIKTLQYSSVEFLLFQYWRSKQRNK